MKRCGGIKEWWALSYLLRKGEQLAYSGREITSKNTQKVVLVQHRGGGGQRGTIKGTFRKRGTRENSRGDGRKGRIWANACIDLVVQRSGARNGGGGGRGS